MKKILSFILVSAMFLSGCNTAERAEQTTKESMTVTTAETTAETTTTNTENTTASAVESSAEKNNEKTPMPDETIISKYFLGVWESENNKFVIGKIPDSDIPDFFSNYGLIKETYVIDGYAVVVCENFISESYRIEIELDKPDVILFYDEYEQRNNGNYVPVKYLRTDNAALYNDTGKVDGYIMSMLYNKYGYIELSTYIDKYTNDNAYFNDRDCITILKSHDKNKLVFVSSFVDCFDTENNEVVFIEYEKLYSDNRWNDGEWQIIENYELKENLIYDSISEGK